MADKYLQSAHGEPCGETATTRDKAAMPLPWPGSESSMDTQPKTLPFLGTQMVCQLIKKF